MQIRSITVFTNRLTSLMGDATRVARKRLENAGYHVQSLRVVLAPAELPDVAGARALEKTARDIGFDFLSIGLVPPALAAEIIPTTEHLFCASRIAAKSIGVDAAAVTEAAAAIVAIGQRTELGFGNLRYAATAYVPSCAPFFPAGYHDGGSPTLALAIEGAPLALEHVRTGGVAAFTQAIEQHAHKIDQVLGNIGEVTSVRYAGCDWSLAPHPAGDRSVGAAVEAVSGVPFGAWGTLAAVHQLTAAIRAANVRRLGFSGVMLPVLEDATLAQRNNEGRFTLRDLLAFSAVCGTGLDTIPLAGDTTAEQIAGVLREVATLAVALDKPLTARLLPAPGLTVGEQTRFEFDYFANTAVMQLN